MLIQKARRQTWKMPVAPLGVCWKIKQKQMKGMKEKLWHSYSLEDFLTPHPALSFHQQENIGVKPELVL